MSARLRPYRSASSASRSPATPRSANPDRARSVSRGRARVPVAPASLIRSEELEVGLEIVRRDLRTVRLPLPALVLQDVLEHLLAERLGDELGLLGEAD